MAQTTASDLFTAIDAYMSTKGHVGGVGYVADKMEGFFASIDTKKITKNLTQSFGLLANAVDDFKEDIENFSLGKSSPFSILRASTKKLNTVLNRFHDRIDGFLKQAGVMGVRGKAVSKLPPTPITTSTGLSKITLFDVNPILFKPGSPLYRYGLPVHLVNIESGLMNRIYNLFKREELLAPPVPVSPTLTAGIEIESEHKKYDKPREPREPKNSKEFGIFGWLATIGSLLGIGYIGSWLNGSAGGQTILSNIKGTISSIFENVTSFITKQSTIDGFKDTISSLVDGAGFLIGSIIDNVVIPIKDRLMKVDWTGQIAKLGNWVWDKILDPWFTSIKNDLSKGEIGNAIIRMIAPIAAVAIPVAISALFFGAAGSFTSILPLVTGLIGSLVSLVVPIAAIVASVTLLNKAWNDYNNNKEFNQTRDEDKAEGEKYYQASYEMRKNITEYEKRLAALNNTDTSLYSEEERNIHELNLKIQRKQLYLENQRLEHALAVSPLRKHQGENPIWGRFDGTVQKLEEIDSNWERRSKETLDSIRKDTDNLNQLKNGKQIKPIAVKDATVIQPHSKDQILMAKDGGPFDLAMKRMNNILNDKLDELIAASVANVQATVQGSGVVAQAVVSSAGKKSGGGDAPFGGGRDPIRDMRDRFNNASR